MNEQEAWKDALDSPVLDFFVGKVMKATRGRLPPLMVRRMVVKVIIENEINSILLTQRKTNIRE